MPQETYGLALGRMKLLYSFPMLVLARPSSSPVIELLHKCLGLNAFSFVLKPQVEFPKPRIPLMFSEPFMTKLSLCVLLISFYKEYLNARKVQLVLN